MTGAKPEIELEPKTVLYLNDDEVKQFMAFRKHQDKFNLLFDSGFFDIRGASGTVHFDPDGNIRKIDRIMVTMVAINLTNQH